MAPRPYSDRSTLPGDSTLNDFVTAASPQDIAENPSPSSLSETTSSSPTPLEVIVTEQLTDILNIQEETLTVDESINSPCYPTSDDIMPYDHSLPDFIRQITNQLNLANVQSLSLRVISTVISLHRMSAYLPNLRELDLGGSVLNSLRDIGCNFKNLQILKVSRCQLESLDGTFGLSSLRELYAQKNLINDVSPCSNLPHIRHIDVSCNRIRNISYAGFLSVCSKLKSIVFRGNPATDVSGYRKHVRRILPQIESLDDLPFTNEDENNEEESARNLCGSFESNSGEISHFLTLSPTDSSNDLADFEENNCLRERISVEKDDKETDYNGTQEASLNLENKNEFQVKIIEHKNITSNQKLTSFQKLNKNVENRSKKSNLFSNNNLNSPVEESCDFLSSSSPSPKKNNLVEPSASKSNLLEENVFFKKESFSTDTPDAGGDHLMNSTPTSEAISAFHCHESTFGEKSEVVKKRSSISIAKLPSGEVANPSDSGISKLTSGSPVCGNLTAALRNRKKISKNENQTDSKLQRLEFE